MLSITRNAGESTQIVKLHLVVPIRLLISRPQIAGLDRSSSSQTMHRYPRHCDCERRNELLHRYYGLPLASLHLVETAIAQRATSGGRTFLRNGRAVCTYIYPCFKVPEI